MRPDEYVRCLVQPTDGKVHYGGMPSIVAYAVRWEIALKDATQRLRTILQVQPRPPSPR